MQKIIFWKDYWQSIEKLELKNVFFRYLKTDKSKIGSEISEIISEIIIFFSKTFLIESKKV